jgi:hypothetical protein
MQSVVRCLTRRTPGDGLRQYNSGGGLLPSEQCMPKPGGVELASRTKSNRMVMLRRSRPEIIHIELHYVSYRTSFAGAGRGNRTPMTLRSADFESAASASSAIPALAMQRP